MVRGLRDPSPSLLERGGTAIGPDAIEPDGNVTTMGIEEADGGTIFLDEVGEMGTPMQVRLLRVLQEGEIRRVGTSSDRKVNVRVISATNVDLETEVRDGRFRKDL